MSDSDPGVAVVGDTTVDLYPTDDGSIAPGSGFEWHVGGTATNAARWAAALGCEVDLVTNVGSDVLGAAAARHLARGAVDTGRVARVDAPSPLTLYTGGAGEEAWNAWVAGSCYGFTPPEDPAAFVEPYDWILLEGVTLPSAVNRTAVRRLAAAATECGTRVAFDLNGRPNQWSGPDEYRDALREVLPRCELLFAGTDDLAVAGVEPTPAGLLELLPADHSATAFVTDGGEATRALRIDDGAIAERVSVAPPSASVATTAGAGDAFAGAVLAARHGGVSGLRRLATIGNAAGAAAVETVGAFDADTEGINRSF
ncbi:PfkB domain-containing protein [Halorubrum coriense DSM 10284]|uniref:PfkB domain-containing protein n=1 Tax=Halorubrum coriense DSM 10284 TaxID=1227466 RepID=M0EJI7_9EURY|nr:PfkB family carbohydrate kinase [Halorubrum coriense]ELZ46569.1 PfkB domain-containing protein [Halorubrum coriense DSM 10284]